jgi:O-antigen/teichoic acid export membrane protein
MVRNHAFVGLLLTGMLLVTCLGIWWTGSSRVVRALAGFALTVGVLLSGAFLRRIFYLQRQAIFAAGTSLVFFVTVACGLLLATRAHVLDGFSAFLILALGWIVAGASLGGKLAFGKPGEHFLATEPGYWREHWKYSQWVLATAFVFQLTSQGYYWLLAGLLSVKEVGELKAMYILVAPVDQIFIALSYLVLPILASHYVTNRMRSFISLWKRYVFAAVGVTAMFALAVRILGRPAMHLVYAGKFDGLAPLLFALALVPLFMGVGNTVNDALKAAEQPRFVFYAYLASGAATFLLGIPLVIHFGLRGAVAGMLVSAATYSCALGAGFLFMLHGQRSAVAKAAATR